MNKLYTIFLMTSLMLSTNTDLMATSIDNIRESLTQTVEKHSQSHGKELRRLQSCAKYINSSSNFSELVYNYLACMKASQASDHGIIAQNYPTQTIKESTPELDDHQIMHMILMQLAKD